MNTFTDEFEKENYPGKIINQPLYKDRSKYVNDPNDKNNSANFVLKRSV